MQVGKNQCTRNHHCDLIYTLHCYNTAERKPKNILQFQAKCVVYFTGNHVVWELFIAVV